MRTVLKIIIILFFISPVASAQEDFATLNRMTYDYFMKGDYVNLKKAGDKLISQGADYYYLRMRLGIGAYNKEKYSEAVNNFKKAISFNSADTVSYEYIYYSYLLSGRKADAALYLKNLPAEKKNPVMLSADKALKYSLFAGSSITNFNETVPETSTLYKECLKSSFNFTAGVETRILSRFRGTFAFTSFTKKGVYLSELVPEGTNFRLTQAQVYANIGVNFFPGWDVAVFGNSAFYPQLMADNYVSEILAGTGISKNLWKIRTGANISFSNFGASRQLREEGYITWLPLGNMNLYFTAGGMFQYDVNWGSTHQINAEAGSRLFKYLWLEAGFVTGNSFLYARNQGALMNNSFHIPATTLYGNFIVLPSKRISVTLSPYFADYQNYSWNLTTFKRTSKKSSNSSGVEIKITYNIR
jgi:hypothetical protein